MRVLFCIACLTLFAPETVGAQDASELFDAWLAQQQAVMRTVEAVQFVEESSLELQGFFGPRNLSLVSNLLLTGNGWQVKRTLDRAHAGSEVRRRPDGRRMPPPIRPDLLAAADEFLLPVSIHAVLRLTDRVSEENWDGLEVTGILLVPRDSSSIVERLTVWFETETARMIRSHAVIAGPEAGTLLSEIKYQRIEGLDVPLSRHLEGSFRMRRRTRAYTIVMEDQAQYRSHELQRRDSRRR